MLSAIERVHDMGYIHRDIKPSNFVMGEGRSRDRVYIVDFGLGKAHLDKNGIPVKQRETVDFRGTVAYASLNAHNKIDLSRRDDLWSWYFVLLDFFNEQLPWRCCKSSKMDEVRDIKAKCLADPEKLLWRTTTSGIQQVCNIFYAIQRLEYADRPDYGYIREQLNVLLAKEDAKCCQALSDTRESVTRKRRSASVAIINTPLPHKKAAKEDIEIVDYARPEGLLVNENFGLFEQNEAMPYGYYGYGNAFQIPYCSDGRSFMPRVTSQPESVIPFPSSFLFSNTRFPIPFSYFQAPIIPAPSYNAFNKDPSDCFKIEIDKEFYSNKYKEAGLV
eukprot:TRINITY_DN7978_c0_g2_i4.p1 TRINITY_DN7978_c0_g2~~TRINITY_DN7978_c0_g2_i4.p1  ORF type:complete len:332 (+),score=35.52 TRINITY_DN7978_c0_g2_i4:549-1544(+)